MTTTSTDPDATWSAIPPYAIAVVHDDGTALIVYVDYLRCDAAAQSCDTSLALQCFSTRAEINPSKLNNRPKAEDLEGMDGNLERANWKHRTELDNRRGWSGGRLVVVSL